MSLRAKVLAGALAGAMGMAGALVTWFEGRSLVAYLDPVGIPTICEGITAGVSLGQAATDEECDALLAGELRAALAIVDRYTLHPQPDTRRAALASFVYNVGPEAFRQSTLLRKLNDGDVAVARGGTTLWGVVGGRELGRVVGRLEGEGGLGESCLLRGWVRRWSN